MMHADNGKDEAERRAPDQEAPADSREQAEGEGQVSIEPETEADLLARIGELEGKVAELEETRLRLLADLENTRRRSAREVEEAGKYAMTKFARDLLEVVDNLGRALAAVPQEELERSESVKRLVEGVAMTEKALLSVFERHRIQRVEPEPGERFDHNRHQAMFESETAEHPPGTITNVMQSGYTISDRLLRPALVGVAKPPEAPEGDGEAEGEGEGNGPDSRPGSRIDTTA